MLLLIDAAVAEQLLELGQPVLDARRWRLRYAEDSASRDSRRELADGCDQGRRGGADQHPMDTADETKARSFVSHGDT